MQTNGEVYRNCCGRLALPDGYGITTPTRRTHPSAIGFTMDFDHIVGRDWKHRNIVWRERCVLPIREQTGIGCDGGLRRVDVKTSHRHNLLNTLRALRLALPVRRRNHNPHASDILIRHRVHYGLCTSLFPKTINLSLDLCEVNCIQPIVTLIKITPET